MTLSLYMERDLGDDSWYGSMLVLNQTIIIATTPLLSYSVYYFRPYQIFIISGCIAIIAPLFFIIGASYFTICVYVILSSIGESLLTPRLLEYSLHVSPKGKEGTIISITNLPLVFNVMVSGIIGTLLLDEFCPDNGERECWKMWVIIAAIAVPPTLVLVFCEKWIADKDFEANPFIFNKNN